MKKVIVLSKTQLRKFISEADNPNFLVIEISSNKENEVTKPSVNCRQYVFQDVDADVKGVRKDGTPYHYEAITQVQAKDIIQFFMDNIDKYDTFVCSCDAGISRSGAVGDMFYRILKYAKGYDVKFVNEKCIFPNVLVSVLLNRAYKSWELGGEFPEIK